MDVEADILIALRKMAGLAKGDDFTIREPNVSFAVKYVGESSSRADTTSRPPTRASRMGRR
jgi:hypothetical protein